MIKLEPVIKELLHRRGIDSVEDTEEFFSPLPVRTYDPFLLKGMKEGVDIIMAAVRDGAKICIYGDYDADGITSVCVMMSVLAELMDPADLTYYIPSRFDEGYGLNMEAIDRIGEQGADLIITVDCGSVSYKEVEHARKIGLDIIVTDHHEIDGRTADCVLINPKQKDCPYPFKGLAGCGVAYKVAQALQRTVPFEKKIINRILDIVAIGTVGDIVPLTDENRTLVKYGLSELNSGRRMSFKLLAEGISLKPGEISSEQIAYGIVPHLNAAGRMERADTGVKLILSTDRNEIMLLTQVLRGYNNKRKEVQEETFASCLELMDEQCADSLFPVIEAEKAHEGIAGIVAGKIKDKTGRPVIITTVSGDDLKGTGRSVASVDMYKMLKKHEELFLRFGGHAAACGFLMKSGNLEKLRKCLNQEMKDSGLTEPDSGNEWELIIAVNDLSLELAEEIERMAPFGSCNPRPVFRMNGVTPENIRFMGSEEQHARFTCLQSGGRHIQCVMFGLDDEEKRQLTSGSTLDLAGEVSVDRWNGNNRTQVLVRKMLRA